MTLLLRSMRKRMHKRSDFVTRYTRLFLRASFGTLLCAFILFGCATFNPYSSEFSCPPSETGKCQSIRDSYDEAKAAPAFGRTGTPQVASKDAYDKAVYDKLKGLLSAPQSPLVAPPQILRVLILPYQDDKRLFMSRHAYIIVDEPRFIMGNYLTQEDKD
jgi:conjugal transfer pilus assembly protein TraV